MDSVLNSFEAVKDYYSRVLKSTADLRTTACCSLEDLPAELREILKDIHPEVKDRFYGCGSPFPPALEGRTVLDLGCGSGRDVYLISKLAGSRGRVIGIDMTDEQLDVARRHIDYHTERFGYSEPNVSFVNGYIEDLEAAGIASNSVDLVVSNCVANLSPDKHRVFSEIFRVLKPGGELYFSDVFADRRIPEKLQSDPVLLGECLGGALYKEDFRRLLFDLGCSDVRAVSNKNIDLGDAEIEERIGFVKFQSITFRAFKLALEDRCEDFGQVAYYLGTIPSHPHSFTLDDHHTFSTNKPMLVCGNTADMVSKTTYQKHFRIVGDKRTHLGLFDCGPSPVANTTLSADCSTGACC